MEGINHFKGVNYKEIKQVHKDTIRVGDVILFDDKPVTIGKEDIKECNFMGRTIRGDSFMLGLKLVDLFIL